MIIQDSFITVTSAREVKEVCAPLNRLGIGYFHYAKMYSDGSVLLLVSNAEWHKHVFLKEKPGPWPSDGVRLEEGCYLWDSIYHYELVEDANNYFDIASGMVLVKKYKGYHDVYSFGAAKGEKDIINFCFNNVDMLEKFTLYFKEKLSKVIKVADNNRIVVPGSMRDKNHLYSSSLSHFDSLKGSFLTDIGFMDQEMTVDRCRLELRKREIDVLNYISKGKTAKEAANILGLAPRTVERYMANAKERLNCYSKSQLIDKFLKNKVEST